MITIWKRQVSRGDTLSIGSQAVQCNKNSEQQAVTTRSYVSKISSLLHPPRTYNFNPLQLKGCVFKQTLQISITYVERLSILLQILQTENCSYKILSARFWQIIDFRITRVSGLVSSKFLSSSLKLVEWQLLKGSLKTFSLLKTVKYFLFSLCYYSHPKIQQLLISRLPTNT